MAILTDEQIKAKNDAANAVNLNAIKVSDLQPVTPLPILRQTPTDLNGLTNTTISATDSIINEYTNLNNQLNAGQQGLKNDGQSIIDLMTSLTGKTEDTLRANEQAGVNSETANLTKYAEQLAGLNAQASSLNREAQAIPLQIQQQAAGTGATDRGVAPIEAGRLRENALRALSIAQQSDIAAAAATGSQLRLQAAKDKAQQIIDLKYKPLEDALVIKKQQYELNKDLLSSIDKKRTEALNLAIQKEEREIAQQKANENAVQSLGLTLAQNQAPQSIINTVNRAKSVKEIMSIPGISKYLLSQSDRLDIAIKSATLQEKRDAAAAAKAAKESGAITPAQAEIATDLRKEYNQLEPVKSLDKSETDTKAILNALKGGKPTDDIAAINSFQRIAVDPGVSVREGDVALLQTANSFGDKAWLRTNGFLVGNKLTPAARAAMQDLTLKIHDSRIGSAVEKTAPIRATAKVYNVDFDSYVASPKKNSQQLLEEVTKQQIPTEQKATTFVSGIKNQLGGMTTGTPFDALFNQSR